MTPEQKSQIKLLLVPDIYGKRPTLQQVGNQFGVSREYIRQIAGNQGCKRREFLAKKMFYWQDRLYNKQDITLTELAKLYGMSRNYTQIIVGSKLDYERRVGKRKCSICGKWKKFPDEFYPANKTSRQTFCKKCNTERTYTWIDANRDQNNKRAREYQKTPQQLAYHRKYYHDNIERIRKAKIRSLKGKTE
jgi:hypothetical protein